MNAELRAAIETAPKAKLEDVASKIGVPTAWVRKIPGRHDDGIAGWIIRVLTEELLATPKPAQHARQAATSSGVSDANSRGRDRQMKTRHPKRHKHKDAES